MKISDILSSDEIFELKHNEKKSPAEILEIAKARRDYLNSDEYKARERLKAEQSQELKAAFDSGASAEQIQNLRNNHNIMLNGTDEQKQALLQRQAQQQHEQKIYQQQVRDLADKEVKQSAIDTGLGYLRDKAYELITGKDAKSDPNYHPFISGATQLGDAHAKGWAGMHAETMSGLNKLVGDNETANEYAKTARLIDDAQKLRDKEGKSNWLEKTGYFTGKNILTYGNVASAPIAGYGSNALIKGISVGGADTILQSPQFIGQNLSKNNGELNKQELIKDLGINFGLVSGLTAGASWLVNRGSKAMPNVPENSATQSVANETPNLRFGQDDMATNGNWVSDGNTPQNSALPVTSEQARAFRASDENGVLRGDGFVTDPKSAKVEQNINANFELAPNTRDLSNISTDEISADLIYLADKHPEMFEKASDVFKLIKEIKDEPQFFYRNNRLDSALIAKRLQEQGKIGKLVVRKENGEVIHATKTREQDLARLERVADKNDERVRALSAVSSRKAEQGGGLPSEIIPQNSKNSDEIIDLVPDENGVYQVAFNGGSRELTQIASDINMGRASVGADKIRQIAKNSADIQTAQITNEAKTKLIELKENSLISYANNTKALNQIAKEYPNLSKAQHLEILNQQIAKEASDEIKAFTAFFNGGTLPSEARMWGRSLGHLVESTLNTAKQAGKSYKEAAIEITNFLIKSGINGHYATAIKKQIEGGGSAKIFDEYVDNATNKLLEAESQKIHKAIYNNEVANTLESAKAQAIKNDETAKNDSLENSENSALKSAGKRADEVGENVGENSRILDKIKALANNEPDEALAKKIKEFSPQEIIRHDPYDKEPITPETYGHYFSTLLFVNKHNYPNDIYKNPILHYELDRFNMELPRQGLSNGKYLNQDDLVRLDDILLYRTLGSEEKIKAYYSDPDLLISGRREIERAYLVHPIKEFGTNYAEFYHAGGDAVKKLLAEKQGQVAGAFYKEGLGDIDVVWGNKEIGLNKITEKHSKDFESFGGVEKGLDEIIANGKNLNENGVDTIWYKKGNDYYAIGISKGFKNKGDNNWIITAYEKKNLNSNQKAKIDEFLNGGDNKTLSAYAEIKSSKTPELTTAENSSANELKSQGQVPAGWKKGAANISSGKIETPKWAEKFKAKMAKAGQEYSDEKIANLANWHKNSHAITKESDGSPKVFYHGTDTKFDYFDKDNTGNGYFFSTLKDEAEFYKNGGYKKEYDSGTMYNTFLNIKKPFEMDKIKINNLQDLQNFAKEIGSNQKLSQKEWEKYTALKAWVDEVRARAKEHGYKVTEIDANEIVLVKGKKSIRTKIFGNRPDSKKAESREAYYIFKDFEPFNEFKHGIGFSNYIRNDADIATFLLDDIRAEYGSAGYKSLKDVLKAKGYDGIKFNEYQYSVFSPNQIKSIDNSGAFNSRSKMMRGYSTPAMTQALTNVMSGGVTGSINAANESDPNKKAEAFVKGFLLGFGGAHSASLLAKNTAKLAPQLARASSGFANDLPRLMSDRPDILGGVLGKINNAKDNFKNIFGGEKAIGANKTKLEVAQDMAKNGADEQQVWAKTGWYKDTDGKWKFEINPKGGELKSVEHPFVTKEQADKWKELYFDKKLSIDEMNKLSGGKIDISPIARAYGEAENIGIKELSQKYPNLKMSVADYVNMGVYDDFTIKNQIETTSNILEGYVKYDNHRLKDVLKDDELFKAYPQLKDVSVSVGDTLSREANGFFIPAQNKIVLGSHLSPAGMKSTLYHEIQHKIQDIEGFGSGADPKMVGVEYAFKTNGEVEARNVEARMDMLEKADTEAQKIVEMIKDPKKAMAVSRDLANVDDYVKLASGDITKGAKHINLRHTSDPQKIGYVTDDEVSRLGENMRKFLLKHKEPYLDGDKFVYEWVENGNAFRLVTDSRSLQSASFNHTGTSAKDEIISFYSNRNLKTNEPYKFKNPEMTWQNATLPDSQLPHPNATADVKPNDRIVGYDDLSPELKASYELRDGLLESAGNAKAKLSEKGKAELDKLTHSNDGMLKRDAEIMKTLENAKSDPARYERLKKMYLDENGKVKDSVGLC